MEAGPSLDLQMLSEQQKKHRTNLWLAEHEALVSTLLNAYLKRLEEGSVKRDEESFIEGTLLFFKVIGSKRGEYFGETLNGPLYPNQITEGWNQKHPQRPITAWDQDMSWPCPPGWSSEDIQGSRVLTYQETKPLSEGLDKLLLYPVAMDCAIVVQLSKWFGLRYVYGNRDFNIIFGYGSGKFKLTQNWARPFNEAATDGNLLYAFYEDCSQITDPLTLRPRVQTVIMYNHPTYLAKHPAGSEELHNALKIDDCFIAFDPAASRIMFSETEFDERLRQKYNLPRDSADLERLLLWRKLPHFVHPNYAPKSFGIMAEEADEYENKQFSETEWKDAQIEREQARSLHFNVAKLLNFCQKFL